MKIPKILIACPTSEVKNYCLEAWLQNMNSIRWANCDILIVDNTNDRGVNMKHIQDACNHLIQTKNVMVTWDNPIGKDSINTVLASGHNKCRQYALENNYDYLLHLESDVFPDPDVLEKLVFHRKRVVSGLYYRDEGKFRKPMIQRSFMKTNRTIGTLNFLHNEDLGFVDGTLKKVPHAGLGCCLIHKTVLKEIKFRNDANDPASPDTFFAMDCHSSGISVYLDTSAICDHKNKNWGAHGVDWK
jgi:hypothetical protein